MLDNYTRDELTCKYYAEFFEAHRELFKENLQEYCRQGHRYVLNKLEKETAKIERRKKTIEK